MLFYEFAFLKIRDSPAYIGDLYTLYSLILSMFIVVVFVREISDLCG